MDLTKRTFTNPITKEKAIILKTSEETSGAYTLIRVTLNTGGGNTIHYHTRFTENFMPHKGMLGIHHEGRELKLTKGDEVGVPPYESHRFYNPTDEDITFDARLEPGQEGFENFLITLFGLVSDGKTFGTNQIPYNPFYAVVLLEWGDTRVDNWMFRFSKPLVRWFLSLSRKRGHEKKLYDTYVKPFRQLIHD